MLLPFLVIYDGAQTVYPVTSLKRPGSKVGKLRCNPVLALLDFAGRMMLRPLQRRRR